ncbi:unnamed protein product [Sympodiomycopsis kandeliae]
MMMTMTSSTVHSPVQSSPVRPFAGPEDIWGSVTFEGPSKRPHHHTSAIPCDYHPTTMSKYGPQAVASVVKLLVPAGQASPQPPVGPALGAKGVKAMDFAKQFNEKTKHLQPGLPTPTIVNIAADRTFTFETRTPPTTLLLKRAAGITVGSGQSGSQGGAGVCGTVSMKHIYEIAKIKIQDVPGVGEQQMCKIVAGSARSMGIRIVR